MFRNTWMYFYGQVPWMGQAVFRNTWMYFYGQLTLSTRNCKISLMRKMILEFVFKMDTMDKHRFIKSTIISFAGIFGMGFFLSLLIMADYGTDPYTFMNRAIASTLGMTLGNWQLLINIVFLLIVIIFDRKLIGPGTIFNMVLIGYYADFFVWLWKKLLPPGLFVEQPSRALVFAVAIAAFVVCAAVYMNADAGLSPYDGSCKIFTEAVRRKWKGIPFFILRIVCDTAVILIGMAAGGRPTIGIIIIALTLGPAISIVGKLMKGADK